MRPSLRSVQTLTFCLAAVTMSNVAAGPSSATTAAGGAGRRTLLALWTACKHQQSSYVGRRGASFCLAGQFLPSCFIDSEQKYANC